MPEEMSDELAISALNRMDAEQRAFEQLNTARKHVRNVLLRFQQVKTLLPDLESQKFKLEGQISTLQTQLNEGLTKIEKEFSQRRGDLRGTTDALNAEINALIEKRDGLVREVTDNERLAADRKSLLDREIHDRESKLTTAKHDLETFKRDHKLE